MRRKADKPINNNDMTLKTNSLCWECARSCGGANCPWADDLKPVKGWIVDSEKTLRTRGATVLYCPMFFKGRSSDSMTEEQIQSRYTNDNPKVSRLHTKLIRNTEGKLIGKYFVCPICGSKYESKISSCTNPECGVTFLYDNSSVYSMNHTNIQLRNQFLKDYKEDFPNSKLNTNGGK